MVISGNFHEKSTFLCGICSESHKLSLITRKTRQIQNEGHSKGYPASTPLSHPRQGKNDNLSDQRRLETYEKQVEV